MPRHLMITLCAAALALPGAAQSYPPPPLTPSFTVAQAHRGPLMISSVHHTCRSPLGPGDRLLVQITGEPGCRATFDVLGVASDQPMEEKGPGQYVGQLILPAVTEARQTKLFGRLRRDDREVEQLCKVPVLLDCQARVAPTGQFADPSEGAVVRDLRPLLNVSFDRPLQPESAHLKLDGKEVSGLFVEGNTICYLPLSDLALGSHLVVVQARDSMGALLVHQWSFQVAPEPGDHGSAPGTARPRAPKP